MSDMYIFFYPS